MCEFICNHVEAICTLVGGFFAGGFTVHFIDKRKYNTKIKQKNITSMGDVAGRDIYK